MTLALTPIALRVVDCAAGRVLVTPSTVENIERQTHVRSGFADERAAAVRASHESVLSDGGGVDGGGGWSRGHLRAVLQLAGRLQRRGRQQELAQLLGNFVADDEANLSSCDGLKVNSHMQRPALAQCHVHGKDKTCTLKSLTSKFGVKYEAHCARQDSAALKRVCRSSKITNAMIASLSVSAEDMATLGVSVTYPVCTERASSRPSRPLQPAGHFNLGDKVVIGKTRRLEGAIRYFGGVVFAAGDWVGIELTDPQGKNDGCVQGIQYFACQPNCGLFVRAGILQPEAYHQADYPPGSPMTR